MLLRWRDLGALLWLAMCVGEVAEARAGIYVRDATGLTTTAEATTTTGGKTDQTAASTSQTSTETTATSAKSTATAEATTSTTATATATGDGSSTTSTLPSAINGNDHSNSSLIFVNATIPAGQLPLQPVLTPGWGVTGAILLTTGSVYALIGIKNQWLHTFFSTAYLASLSVTVLIIYVMVPPISNAVQGAYVVAAACTGIILGGAAIVFRELTEGLGCLLGGFCLSMWLLTLRSGGLLQSAPAKIIFISVFSLFGFGFYFSRYTRPYALIGLMSFGGATVTVLGIDCFSRAGLKEFWVYIWALNNKLFPLGADTYPLTKGIRVEIAVIIIITVAGVISQLKLWRVIQQHRAKKAEERAEEQRRRDEEEAVIGQQLERDNARDLRAWENAYGDGPGPAAMASSVGGSDDSGLGSEVESEKKRMSRTTVKRVSSSSSNDAHGAIEMAELAELPETTDAATAAASEVPPQPQPIANGLLVMGDQEEDSRVTVRVAADDDAPAQQTGLRDPIPEPDEKAWMAASGDGEGRRASRVASPGSQRLSRPPAPEITPLPFRIPAAQEGDDDVDHDDGERSSFATFADEDDRRLSRSALVRRLSAGSGHLLRSLSRSSSTMGSQRRKSARFEPAEGLGPAFGESFEDLVPRGNRDRRPSAAESVAATIDDMSLDDEEQSLDEDGRGGYEPPLLASTNDVAAVETVEKPAALEMSGVEAKLDAEPRSSSDEDGPYASARESKRSSVVMMMEAAGKTEATTTNDNDASQQPPVADAAAAAAEVQSETSKPARSAAGRSASSTSEAGLTRERLPAALSRVAMSYRTNEWAKHLSLAETPEVEDLRVQQESGAVPVDVEGLRQTPESGIPAAAAAVAAPVPAPAAAVQRSPSAAAQPVYRSASRASLTPSSSNPSLSPPPASAAPSKPAGPPHARDSLRIKGGGGGRRQSSDVHIQPILEEERGDEQQQSASTRQSSEDNESGVSSSSPTNSPFPEQQHQQQQQQRRRSSTTANSRAAAAQPIPGVVSYSSPQTLLGKRDMFLRSRTASSSLSLHQHHHHAPLPQGAIPEDQQQDGSPAADLPDGADDMPLSQRRSLLRRSSVQSLSAQQHQQQQHQQQQQHLLHRSTSTLSFTQQQQHQQQVSEGAQFDSNHQPQRRSTAPSARDARLASFRQSVAADLRAGTPVLLHSSSSSPSLEQQLQQPYQQYQQQQQQRSETPLGFTAYGGLTSSLSAGSLPLPQAAQGSHEVGRAMSAQRGALLAARAAEGQRRELAQRAREHQERAFEERMRSGELLDAHREAMRRMQARVGPE
ncbi:hypothetical protein GGR56DRAFT_671341 [Xylariaceae sp. FL0804]|nr:hypothetical protein GGR56DRAFT_671341 [Xylariaceae sp. FL0804]